MANAQRLRRVGGEIQRELAEILRAELKDPRVGMITLTGVEVSPDLAHAKVFFTSLAGADRKDEAAAGLRRASGFLRSMLGTRLRIHNTPELHFEYDASVESGIRLTHLIEEAVAADVARAPGGRPARRRSSRTR
jgi:ribosome-binding factor A